MIKKERIRKYIPRCLLDLRRTLITGSAFLASSYKLKLEEYYKIINKRKLYNFSDIELLAEDIPIGLYSEVNHGYGEYNFYGSYYTLLRYLDLDFFHQSNYFTIQHGMKFSSGWNKDYYRNLNKYLCWGEYEKLARKNECDADIVEIGAPFFYAKGLLNDDEIMAEKKRLGRNLLVFPSHSTHHNTAKFDIGQFIKNVDKQKEKFDTIRICIYWKDILNGYHKYYIDHGYECVCSGHIFDLNFLRRQKSLIEIADCTYSNSVGSQIGYSVFSDKPHFLEPLKTEYEFDQNQYGPKEYDAVLKNPEYMKIVDIFSHNSEYSITNEQLTFLDPHFGYSKIKSKEELLRELFE